MYAICTYQSVYPRLEEGGYLKIPFYSDINYLNCAMPPPDCLSQKQQRDKYRQKLLAAFGEYYHPDHSVPMLVNKNFHQSLEAYLSSLANSKRHSLQAVSGRYARSRQSVAPRLRLLQKVSRRRNGGTLQRLSRPLTLFFRTRSALAFHDQC